VNPEVPGGEIGLDSQHPIIVNGEADMHNVPKGSYFSVNGQVHKRTK
jgi:hypothetical protein